MPRQSGFLRDHRSRGVHPCCYLRWRDLHRESGLINLAFEVGDASPGAVVPLDHLLAYFYPVLQAATDDSGVTLDDDLLVRGPVVMEKHRHSRLMPDVLQPVRPLSYHQVAGLAVPLVPYRNEERRSVCPHGRNLGDERPREELIHLRFCHHWHPGCSPPPAFSR